MVCLPQILQHSTDTHAPVQKPDSFEVKGDLPGVKEEDVKLSIDGDVLSLSVENQGKENKETKEEVRGPLSNSRTMQNSTWPAGKDCPQEQW